MEVRRRLDMYGGGVSIAFFVKIMLKPYALLGSHAIWHCFIVLAVYQHKTAMASLRNGLRC